MEPQMRKLLLAGFSAVALMFSATPSHAILTIVGGVAAVTPVANDVIPGVAGVIGGNLSATAGTYEYTFIGFEAGFSDFFTAPGNSFHNQTTAAGTSFQIAHAGGTLLFDFLVQHTLEDVNNGFNNPPGTHPNFFLGDAGGGGVYIALDDGGAGPDDNHDDLVVLVREVGIPEPASLALFGAALAGLALIRRRKA